MNFKSILPLLAVVAIAGCENFLEETPEDRYTSANFPGNEADVNLALGGIQKYFTTQDNFSRGWWMISEMPSDQTFSTATTGSRFDHEVFVVTPENEWIGRTWKAHYQAVNAANILIAKIPGIQSMSEAKRAQYLGAAKFWRGWSYLNLVRAWGDIPLHVEPVTELEVALATTRSPIAEVYALIVADLEEAAASLPASWPEGLGKPTSGAAYAALADAYLNMSGDPLMQNRWADAARAAQGVINLGAHRLRPEYADLWKIENKTDSEFIFAILFADDGDGVVTVQSHPSGVGVESGWYYWNSSEEFMNTFSDADARKGATFLTEVQVGSTRYSYDGRPGTSRWGGTNPMGQRPTWAKYWDSGRSSFTDRARRTDANVPIYRYADALLMLAEAENEVNGPTERAYEAINEVRLRAGLPPLSGLSQTEFREAVRQERSWELAFEMKRWFDLKRWGTWMEVLSEDPRIAPNIKSHHRWSPLPQQELDNSPALTQNPGY